MDPRCGPQREIVLGGFLLRQNHKARLGAGCPLLVSDGQHIGLIRGDEDLVPPRFIRLAGRIAAIERVSGTMRSHGDVGGWLAVWQRDAATQRNQLLHRHRHRFGPRSGEVVGALILVSRCMRPDGHGLCLPFWKPGEGERAAGIGRLIKPDIKAQVHHVMAAFLAQQPNMRVDVGQRFALPVLRPHGQRRCTIQNQRLPRCERKLGPLGKLVALLGLRQRIDLIIEALVIFECDDTHDRFRLRHLKSRHSAGIGFARTNRNGQVELHAYLGPCHRLAVGIDHVHFRRPGRLDHNSDLVGAG